LEPLVFGRFSDAGRAAPPKKSEKKKDLVPVEPGSNGSKAIILLTDGRRTTGPDPVDAAKMAADRGVKVFTVGFGSPQGGMAGFDGYSIYMAYDEETLKAVAERTKAEYFHAGTAADLAKVYENLSSKLVLNKEETEIAFLFAGLAAALLLLAAGLS